MSNYINDQEEVWKVIEDYPNYMVSNTGKVWGCKRNKLMNLSMNNGGYSVVRLYHNGIRKDKKVARLVAKAFIPNPMNMPTVDYIDRDPLNDQVKNLRWANCTQQSVNQSAYSTSGIKGVYKKGQKWQAIIKYNGKNCDLGTYNIKE